MTKQPLQGGLDQVDKNKGNKLMQEAMHVYMTHC